MRHQHFDNNLQTYIQLFHSLTLDTEFFKKCLRVFTPDI